MMYRVWDRMKNNEKKAVLNKAAAYLQEIDRL
jgi:hypothetical protein